MLTSMEVATSLLCAFVLAPLAAAMLVKKVEFPAGSFFGRLFSAEPALQTIGNILLVTIGAASAVRLLVHFGMLDQMPGERVGLVLGLLLLPLAVAECVLLVRGLRRMSRSQ